MDTSNHNILLIEDSPSQALQFWLLLTNAGYEVRIVSDGREGWIDACNSHPGLILLDVNLPSLNGFQVLSRLKRNRTTADIPVVMLSSHDSVFQVEQALELGADDYLFKEDYTRQNGSHMLQSALQTFFESDTATTMPAC